MAWRDVARYNRAVFALAGALATAALVTALSAALATTLAAAPATALAAVLAVGPAYICESTALRTALRRCRSR